MQFQVNGHDYFLGFDRDQGRWFVFEPTPHGLHRTAIVDDDSEFGEFRFVITPDEEHAEVVN